jgi:hypothetical protein
MDGIAYLAMVCLILACAGAINWGLVGIFKFDLIAFIAGGKKFGQTNIFSRFIYIVIALAGIFALIYVGSGGGVY